jgi:hypothetical protein
MDSGRLQPALYGGLLIGVLSALPFVSAGNCCCCLWVIVGGVLAVYLRQQNSPYAITSAEGALVGLLAGVIGGVIGVILSIPVEAAMGPFMRNILERVASSPDFPAEMRDVVERAGGRGTSAMAIAFKMCVSLVAGGVFGMLGGLLGVAIFKKDGPPPPPPPGTVDILPPE